LPIPNRQLTTYTVPRSKHGQDLRADLPPCEKQNANKPENSARISRKAVWQISRKYAMILAGECY
jgi:hypothetical protein